MRTRLIPCGFKLDEVPIKKGLEGLLVMDELPDNKKETKSTRTASKAKASSSKVKVPVFYKRKKVAKVPVRGDEALN
ncbi:hypothetical protein H0H92_001978, partial [Tricholoma furcatifolium]